MVLLNAGKAARNAASICNRTNVCGGNKKGGLSSSVGWFLTSNVSLRGATNTQFGLKCVGNYSHQVQKTGYRATIGGV